MTTNINIASIMDSRDGRHGVEWWRGTCAPVTRFMRMEFSRHPDARIERLDQIATMLRGLYPPPHEAFPPVIAEELEQLEHIERDADPNRRTDRR
jgi:hypothetical protein